MKKSINDHTLSDDERTVLRRADMIRLQSNPKYLGEVEGLYAQFKDAFARELLEHRPALVPALVNGLADHDAEELRKVQKTGEVQPPEVTLQAYCKLFKDHGLMDEAPTPERVHEIQQLIYEIFRIREATTMAWVQDHDVLVKGYLGYSLLYNVLGMEDPVEQYKKP